MQKSQNRNLEHRKKFFTAFSMRFGYFFMFLPCIDNRLCGYQIQISKYYKNKSKFLKNIEAAKCSKKQPNRTLSKGFLI